MELPVDRYRRLVMEADRLTKRLDRHPGDLDLKERLSKMETSIAHARKIMQARESLGPLRWVAEQDPAKGLTPLLDALIEAECWREIVERTSAEIDAVARMTPEQRKPCRARTRDLIMRLNDALMRGDDG